MTKEDIEKIYYKLLEAGAGDPPTEMVMMDDEMFDKYLELKKKNVSDMEIAFQMQEEWLKRKPNATMKDFYTPLPTVKQLAGMEENPFQKRREKLVNFRFERQKKRKSIN